MAGGVCQYTLASARVRHIPTNAAASCSFHTQMMHAALPTPATAAAYLPEHARLANHAVGHWTEHQQHQQLGDPTRDEVVDVAAGYAAHHYWWTELMMVRSYGGSNMQGSGAIMVGSERCCQ